MNKLLHPLYGYPLAVYEFLGAVARTARHLGLDHMPHAGCTIPRDFFGVNIAPGDQPETDDYILQRLEELDLRQVRMDFSYSSNGGPAQRLLDKLLARDYSVMLDVLPPLAEAEILCQDVEAQQRWAKFLADLFRQYGGRVHCFEIGNTPNRGRWSGFSSRSFVMACHIAQQQAAGLDLRLAGPNVSDFEPLYNATYLSMLDRFDAVPQVHTDNLFVERVVEPEAFDHRVLGRMATHLLKLNLVKKARVLQAIGEAAGCDELVCTYTCWTIKRLNRRSAWPEQKRVDYLVRYLALAACSGALRRVYWGPLICHRDGLIDDGAADYPAIDQVSFYEKIRGESGQFEVSPGYYALRHVIERLAGSHCSLLEHQPQGLSLLYFRSSTGGYFLLAWCRDGMSRPLDQLLDAETLRDVQFSDALGKPMERPAVVSEHPVFIDLPGPWLQPDPDTSPVAATAGIVHLNSPCWQSIEYCNARWTGARMLRATHQLRDLEEADKLAPEQIPALEETRVLRDVRNRLWNVADPRGICDQVTIKLNRVQGLKRLTYRFRPSKGRRHWNNACDMLRRGIATPLPIAFYEYPEKPGINESWYLCQFIPNALSARDVYAAFREGATEYLGMDKAAWFDLLSAFVCNMHNKQVVHRDLSAGNLLLEPVADGSIRPQVIDIGRAWVWSGPGSRVQERHRLLDLIRIAYKLDWSDRRLFITRYEAHLGKPLSPLWRIPFFYYDSKQRLKKTLKGERKKRRGSH